MIWIFQEQIKIIHGLYEGILVSVKLGVKRDTVKVNNKFL